MITEGARGYSLKAGTRDAIRSHIMVAVGGVHLSILFW
jgi:hypothetical protein